MHCYYKSQRANNARINALNTYILGEVMKRIMGDELNQEYLNILEKGRQKANYYVSRNVEEITKEELQNFYNIGEVYRNE